ncbi:DUF4202 family protein [Candidatus Latescibacterota bacterium]
MESEAIKKLKDKIDEIILSSPYSEDVFHSINTLEWLLKLHPDADIALRIAALGHDIERGLDDRKIRSANFETYNEFKQAHALNCAEILVEIMEDFGVEQSIIDDVAHLVANHEVGGNEREELLKDADTLSFFHVCLPLYYDRKGPEMTKKRCVWGFKKLSDHLKKDVLEIEFPDNNLKQLVIDSVVADSD